MQNVLFEISPKSIFSLEKTMPPIRYPGSKFRAAKHLIKFLAIDHEKYREPFLGSAAIFFVKPLVKANWLNDIDRDLIITFQVIADPQERELLKTMVSEVVPSKEFFEKLKIFEPQNPLEIAYRYFVINRTAYSGIMNMPNWGFHPIKSVQPSQWAQRIEMAGKKLENVKITNIGYQEVILEKSEKKVFLFVDPPYFKADQKRAYLHSFKHEDHLELVKVLQKTPHKFCLTYDNCEEIKELYSWANLHEQDWRYHTANSNVTTRKMGKELIITNF